MKKIILITGLLSLCCISSAFANYNDSNPATSTGANSTEAGKSVQGGGINPNANRDNNEAPLDTLTDDPSKSAGSEVEEPSTSINNNDTNPYTSTKPGAGVTNTYIRSGVR